jgi:predicted Zn-dependent protease
MLATGLSATQPVAGLTPSDDPFDLPDFGSSASTVLSRVEQRELGREFMKWVRKSLPVADAPLIEDYLNQLGQELVAAGDNPGRYRFFLVNEPTVNAFAGPDGHIGVFAGLILAAQTEAELAAVLAHEIAHVSQDHLLRAIETQKRLALPTAAMLLAAAVLGAAVDAELGSAAMVGIQGAAAQQRINFTRGNEEEADRIGIATLAKAGHDPFAMPGFFQRLAKATRVHQGSAPEYLRTHPVTSNRIADALARAERYGHRQRPDSLRFHLVRADLRQRSHRQADRAVDHFRETLRQGRYRNLAAERYGYALALARNGAWSAAAEQTALLLEEHPSQPELIVLKARIDAATGRIGQALKALKSAVGLSPDSLPLNQFYARLLLAADRPKEALAVLERFVGRRDAPAPIYGLMADAAGKAGQRAENYRWRAEYLYRTGELEPAIRQLELALRLPDPDFHLASRIQVRLQALKREQERREEEK